MQSTALSQQRSLSALNIVKPLLEVVVGHGNVNDHLVRKLAHFTEFAVLDAELSFLLIFLRKVRFQPIINCSFFALSCAVIDETIQIFSSRGSQVQDVLLDFSGALTGIFLVFIVYLPFHHKRLKKERRQTP